MRSTTLDLLDSLAAEERTWLTTADVRERLDLSSQAASNLLSRLVRDGLLDRVTTGVYSPRPLGLLGTRAASEDIAIAVGAAFGGETHRIAYRSALHHHGLLTHPARVIQVALPRRVKIERLSGRRLQAIFDSGSYKIGVEDAGHRARVSSLERVLLESATRPSLVGGWTVLAGCVERGSWDPEKLELLAEQLDEGIALRRIGSIAEQIGQEELASKLPTPLAASPIVKLDPHADQDEQWLDRRWAVRWPVAPSTAREIVAQ